MKIEHLTGMETGYNMGLCPDGQEEIVVCVKGTFNIPENGGELELAEKQEPLVDSDLHTGIPGQSATLYESDFALFKPRCDVLVNGSAYAPNGTAVEKVDVYLGVGPISKSFQVVGNRYWKKSMGRISATRPEPFTCMPISYDCAFGGMDTNHEKEKKHRFFAENLYGKGYHHYLNGAYINGTPLPNTQELRNTIKKPNGKYRPMAFGPIARAHPDRIKLAGTYDQHWQDNVFPFLAADFDYAYCQSAPLDQQMPHPQKSELVRLINLTPEGKTEFILPRINLLAWFFLLNGDEIGKQLRMDTIVIEPDQRRVMVTCRASMPLKKNMMEVEMVVLGLNTDERDEVLNSSDNHEEFA